VLCIKQRHCIKRQYITVICAVKTHFYTQISVLNCTTQSKASEEVVNSCICKCIPELVPVVSYSVLKYTFYFIVYRPIF
jgi:hypothetical protein